jgi:hypothetical protein
MINIIVGPSVSMRSGKLQFYVFCITANILKCIILKYEKYLL